MVGSVVGLWRRTTLRLQLRGSGDMADDGGGGLFLRHENVCTRVNASGDGKAGGTPPGTLYYKSTNNLLPRCHVTRLTRRLMDRLHGVVRVYTTYFISTP